MKVKLFQLGLLVSTLGLMSGLPAIAQAEFVTPHNLIVAGTRNMTVTRTLQLQTTPPVTDLQMIPFDLSNADGMTVLPAKVIQPTLSTRQIKAKGLLSVPVAFNLGDAPSSGEFSGELLVKYAGGEQTVPLIVRIKDPWPLPLAVLITGVALGTCVSVYRLKGRPRDEILVRVSQLRTQMQTDPDLMKAKSFQSKIEEYLLDVEVALQAEKWEDARGSLEKADAVWMKWRRGHDDWLAQLDYHSQLQQRLQQLPDTPYVQSVLHSLQAAVQNAPDRELKDLREQLDTCKQQIDRYLQLQKDLAHLNELGTQLPKEQQTQRSEAQSLEERLNALVPTDLEAYRTLQNDIKTAIAKLEPLVVKDETRGLLSPTTLKLPSPPPLAQTLTVDKAMGAQIRLQIFFITSYAIAVALLAGAGFTQLYVAKPTFGADYWSDYFTLLAWGFGAEATRDSVTKVVRDWGLAGLG